MSKLSPVSRRELIKRLLSLGFDGPFSGGRHEFLVRNNRRLILPNPHRGEVSPDCWLACSSRLTFPEKSGKRQREEESMTSSDAASSVLTGRLVVAGLSRVRERGGKQCCRECAQHQIRS